MENDRRWAGLMAAAQAGDGQSYATLLRDCVPIIKSVALRTGVPGGLVDDVVQEVLIAVHRARATYDPRYPFSPWLRTIAQRRAIDLLRSAGRWQARELHAPDDYAGHPDPVLAADGDARFVSAPIGAPLGVVNPESYSAVTVSIPLGATVLAYTDGLVERRGEHLDIGRERLRTGARDVSGSLEDQLGRIVAHTIPNGSPDDTAILGLRWLS